MQNERPVIGLKGARARVPFSQTPNAMLRDARLSSDARFLLAYLESFEPGWVFYADRMRRDTGWGKEKLQGVMRECVAYGALRVDQLRKPGGSFGGQVLEVRWDRWASAISAEMMGFSPEPENPSPVETLKMRGIFNKPTGD